MRTFIKSFLFTVFLLLPYTVHADECSTYYSTQSACDDHLDYCKWENGTCTERCPTTTGENPTCTNWNGCYLDTTNIFGSSCSPCDPGTYNNTSGAHNCQSCSSFSYSTGQIFDTAYANTYGLDTCPWVCKDGYFDNSDHSQCLSCPTNNNGFMTYPDNNDVPTSDCANTCDPGTYIIDTLSSAGSSTNRYYCGQCGLGSRVISGAVSTCICNNAPGVVQIYGGGPDRTTMRVECECTAGATWQDGACKCGVNTYLTPTNDGYICQSCPMHSSTLQQIGKTSPDECLCDAGYYMSRNECKSCPEHANCSYYGRTYENVQCASGYQKIPDPDTQTFVCRSCSDAHAQLDDNGTGNCLCNPGYYGEIQGLQTPCTQCPIGTTTTTIGATQRSDCKMTSATKFCYGSGDNKKCMNLIPAGTVISVSNNT